MQMAWDGTGNTADPTGKRPENTGDAGLADLWIALPGKSEGLYAIAF